MAVMHADEQAIFEVARKIDAREAREAYLQQICGDDPAVAERVRALLKAYEESASFLESPAVALGATGDLPAASETETRAAPPPERPGTVIGPYKLIEQIGEGGMGTVWMAQQTEPVKRLVAVKLIKAGMDSRQVIARFEAERQALALMEHPNIARVLDAGTTDAGRPYFVMDLVKGVPITKYCDEHHLTPRQRLELFLPICQAVQHAHQKGIIHRDLKPSNVLVALYDGKPVPKVIDFGVAKATGQHLTDKTLVTGFGALVGTLEYMSPEQAEINQLDIDTRSDIYTLGVVLYELLTGSPPLSRTELETVGMLETLRLIREQEPPKPSTRLSTAEGLPTLAANRGTEPAKLTKLVRGELDWIVMKALEKDRNRRYETANGFAMDVQRYLADETVQACPPSAGYRLRKFARRNKRALVTVSVISLALLLVAGSLGWVVRDRAAGRVRATAEVNQFLERAKALYEENKLPEAVAEVEKARGVLEAGRGDEELGRRVRQWRTDLDTAARLDEISPEWNDFDRVTADCAQVFREYGIDVDALPDEEVTARVAASQIRFVLVRALGNWAGWLRSDPGPEAFARRQRLIAIATAAEPDPWYLRLQAAAKAKDMRTLREMAGGADPSRTRARTLAYVGGYLRVAGDLEAAVAFLRKVQRHHSGDFIINTELAYCLSGLNPPPWDEVIAFRRVALAARPQSTWAHHLLAIALRGKNRFDEAIVEHREVIRLRPVNADSHNSLGLTLHAQKKMDEAIASFRTAISIDPKLVLAHVYLGRVLRDQKKLDEAIAEYHKALAIDPNHAWAHNELGLCHSERKNRDAAIACYKKAIEIDANYAGAHYNLGKALFDQKKLDEAIAEYRTAISIDPKHVGAHNNLGYVLRGQNRLDEAIAEYRTATSIDPKDALAHTNLGNALFDQKKLDEAIAEYRTVISIDPRYAGAHYNLGVVLSNQKKLDEAIAEYRTAISIDPKDAKAHNNLGNALFDQKKLDEAITEYRTVISIDPEDARAHNNLGNALHGQKKLCEAIAEYRKAIAIDPKYARAHFSLGVVLHEQKNVDEAVAEYRTAIAIDPNHTDAHYGLGLALLDQKKLDEAIVEYRTAILLKPDFAGAHDGLGNALKAQDKLDEAIAEYRAAIAIDPKFAGAHNNLGSALHMQKKLDEAVKEYRTAIAIDPKAAQPHQGLGNVLKDQDKLDEAIDCCKKALAIDPNYAAAHNVLGVALKRQNKLHAAIAEYRRAIALDPKVSHFHHNLGIALHALNRLDEAVAAYREAIALDRKAAGAHGNLGYTLAAQNKLEDAIAAYREAIRIQPDYSFTHNQLGLALMRQGKLDASIACFREAVRLKPDYAFAYFNLGMALRDRKKPDEAIASYRKAIEIAPNYAAAHITLGNVLREQGKLDEAITAYFGAFPVKPDYAAAHYGVGLARSAQGRWVEAKAAYQEAIRNQADFYWARRDLALLLTACPDPKLHDPRLAVEHARKAVELRPQSSEPLQVLGWAQYRAGAWRESIEALERSCKLQPGGTGDHGQWIVLALAHAKLAVDEGVPDLARALHRTEARRWYEQADKQIDSKWRVRPDDGTNQAIWDFREEARALLRAKLDKK